MDIEMLNEIQHALTDKVHDQLDNLDGVCTSEMGEVVDMIKDLAETVYYCTIVAAMESQDEPHWESGK
jgi:hypothetical protein